MAGKGKRFAEAGYAELKPFIQIDGKPMVEHVIANLTGWMYFGEHVMPHQVILVVDPDIEERYAKELASLSDKYNVRVVSTNGEVQHGQAWSCRVAESLIDNETPLLIANSDQILMDYSENWLNEWLAFIHANPCDGSVALFWNNHPKWSYAKVANGLIVETAEKQVISEHATVGLYYFNKGHDFITYSDQMIVEQETVNGEYYVCPVYNRMIQEGAQIKPYWFNQVWGIGTPVDLNKFAKQFNLEVKK